MSRQRLREHVQGVGRYSLNAVLALGRISAFVWAMAAHSVRPPWRFRRLVDEVFDWAISLDGDQRRLLLTIAMGAIPAMVAEDLGISRSALDWRVKAACGSIVARLKDGRLRSKAPKSGA